MQRTLMERQIIDAKNNFNYFFMSMIIKIARNILLVTFVLFLNQIFNYLFVYIMTLLYLVYTIYKIYFIIDSYFFILNDIKETLNNQKFYYIIDFNYFKNNLLKVEFKYGK